MWVDSWESLYLSDPGLSQYLIRNCVSTSSSPAIHKRFLNGAATKSNTKIDIELSDVYMGNESLDSLLAQNIQPSGLQGIMMLLYMVTIQLRRYMVYLKTRKNRNMLREFTTAPWPVKKRISRELPEVKEFEGWCETIALLLYRCSYDQTVHPQYLAEPRN